jgi:PAS domain S-box-containing protein
MDIEKQAEYYKNIAEKTGQKRLREVEQLHRLISEHRESEHALRTSEQRFRLIAQSTNDIFYEWDIGSGALHWFGDIDGALGYETGKINHTLEAWLAIIHPMDKELIEEAVLLHKQSRKPIRYKYRVHRKDGSTRYWSDCGSPILNEDGNPQQWVGGISDITEREIAEEALRQAQRLGAIGELASGIAHDFNNSLQGMIGNTELALLERISPEVKTYLETVKQIATDAVSRIHQLQRFSGEGGGRKSYEHICMNSLVETAVSQTRPLWKGESEKKGITIIVEKNYGKGEMPVFVNPGEIRTALYNLIKNSIQAMPAGGRLSFGTRSSENHIFVTVSDTGSGMDGETRARVFQPFFSTKVFEHGKGLGMSTSYAIIKEHNGKIAIKESAPGEGTTIEIKLPRSENEIHRHEDSTVLTDKRSARVLWIDDDEMIRKLGKRMLTVLHHKVDVAENGVEAIDLLKRSRYDLMISDVGMPGMNGWQLVEKTKDKYPDMKVALVTGWETDLSDEDKKRYGVHYVLVKPIFFKQLENMVAEVLQANQK